MFSAYGNRWDSSETSRDQIYKLQDLQSRNMPVPNNEPLEIEALICDFHKFNTFYMV
ncbi:Uncharacterized protein TCM_021664 [Theobroma cacao]|uniref:Uncharacterized protein n=1 Tax=Theobroma cacao TaxID=3641 RepID=A0A061EY48_THECC|nr:Uncharacterized protein TCM_021664 [Theobroma cacao]